MAVIFIFIDGVGLGEKVAGNPFYVHEYESFQQLSGGNFFKNAPEIVQSSHLFKGIDANLDVEGLPQSGTGQTTLFSGENASKIIGKHFGPYPHSGIRHLLEEKSIFHDLVKLGKKPYFMNAYPPVFFETAGRRNRWTATTLMVQSAGITLNSTQEILNGTAVTAEIIQKTWREILNIDIPEITEAQAAQRLLNAAEDYDLVLFEYYLTDKAGHSRSQDDAHRVISVLDRFLQHLINHKKEEDILLITSDHGNLEDLSTKSHTRNKVPLFVMGEGAEHFAGIESLIDVKDGILRGLSS